MRIGEVPAQLPKSFNSELMTTWPQQNPQATLMVFPLCSYRITCRDQNTMLAKCPAGHDHDQFKQAQAKLKSLSGQSALS